MVRRNSNNELIQTHKTEIKKEYGRGNRIRKQVNYRDDLLDEQLNNIYMEVESEEGQSSLIQVPKEKKVKKIKKTIDNNFEEKT